MRLALITYYPANAQNISGGVDTVSYNLVQALRADAGLDLHVITCRPDVPADDTTVEDGVTFHRLSTQRRRILPNLVTTVFRIGTVLAQVQPDLVNAHTGEFATAALRLGLPTVYTVHGLAGHELRAPASAKQRIALLVMVAYERYALRRARHVIALTPFGEAYLRPHTQAVLHRVDNPVAPRFFDLPPATADNRLLALGHIFPRKNQITLVEAMDRVRQARPDVTLRIVGGETDPQYAARVHRAVAEHRLEQQVIFGGRLSAPAIVDCLADSTLLLHAAHHEHAPMVVAEAMAAGRPVIASRAGGTPALLTDGETGFLTAPTDAAAFADRVVQLLRDPDLRQAIGARARAAARQRFWPDVVAARYRAVYDIALGRTGAAGAQTLSPADLTSDAAVEAPSATVTSRH